MADPVGVIVIVVVVLLCLVLCWFVYTCVKRCAPPLQDEEAVHHQRHELRRLPEEAADKQRHATGHGTKAAGGGGTPAAAQTPQAAGGGGTPASAQTPQAAGGGGTNSTGRGRRRHTSGGTNSPGRGRRRHTSGGKAAGGGGTPAAAQTPQATGGGGTPAAAQTPQAAGGGGTPAAAQTPQAAGGPTTGHGTKQQATTGTSSAANGHYTDMPDKVMSETIIEVFLREMSNQPPIRFKARQLVGFTDSYSTKIGHGGFGAVFKGTLPNGLDVAVKVLHDRHDQKTLEQQFMAEILTISRTRHINLVRLYGFCSDGATQALVYEYMEKGSLDDYLSARGAPVRMAKVVEIATGVAKGLRYLHEEGQQKILHLDIKPGNVLLGGDRKPKLADFGLARLVDPNNTHISVTHACGTPGYAPPEFFYGADVHLTEKCDVYSFGILLLTIVGRGRKWEPENQQPLARAMMAWKMYREDKLMEFVGGPGNDEPRRCRELVEMMCKVAFCCLQRQPKDRPSMSAVVKMLEGEKISSPPYPFQYLDGPANQ